MANCPQNYDEPLVVRRLIKSVQSNRSSQAFANESKVIIDVHKQPKTPFLGLQATNSNSQNAMFSFDQQQQQQMLMTQSFTFDQRTNSMLNGNVVGMKSKGRGPAGFMSKTNLFNKQKSKNQPRSAVSQAKKQQMASNMAQFYQWQQMQQLLAQSAASTSGIGGMLDNFDRMKGPGDEVMLTAQQQQMVHANNNNTAYLGGGPIGSNLDQARVNEKFGFMYNSDQFNDNAKTQVYASAGPQDFSNITIMGDNQAQNIATQNLNSAELIAPLEYALNQIGTQQTSQAAIQQKNRKLATGQIQTFQQPNKPSSGSVQWIGSEDANRQHYLNAQRNLSQPHMGGNDFKNVTAIQQHNSGMEMIFSQTQADLKGGKQNAPAIAYSSLGVDQKQYQAIGVSESQKEAKSNQNLTQRPFTSNQGQNQSKNQPHFTNEKMQLIGKSKVHLSRQNMLVESGSPNSQKIKNDYIQLNQVNSFLQKRQPGLQLDCPNGQPPLTIMKIGNTSPVCSRGQISKTSKDSLPQQPLNVGLKSEATSPTQLNVINQEFKTKTAAQRTSVHVHISSSSQRADSQSGKNKVAKKESFNKHLAVETHIGASRKQNKFNFNSNVQQAKQSANGSFYKDFDHANNTIVGAPQESSSMRDEENDDPEQRNSLSGVDKTTGIVQNIDQSQADRQSSDRNKSNKEESQNEMMSPTLQTSNKQNNMKNGGFKKKRISSQESHDQNSKIPLNASPETASFDLKLHKTNTMPSNDKAVFSKLAASNSGQAYNIGSTPKNRKVVELVGEQHKPPLDKDSQNSKAKHHNNHNINQTATLQDEPFTLKQRLVPPQIDVSNTDLDTAPQAQQQTQPGNDGPSFTNAFEQQVINNQQLIGEPQTSFQVDYGHQYRQDNNDTNMDNDEDDCDQMRDPSLPLNVAQIAASNCPHHSNRNSHRSNQLTLQNQIGQISQIRNTDSFNPSEDSLIRSKLQQSGLQNGGNLASHRSSNHNQDLNQNYKGKQQYVNKRPSQISQTSQKQKANLMMSPTSQDQQNSKNQVFEGINAGVGTDDLEPILDRSLTQQDYFNEQNEHFLLTEQQNRLRMQDETDTSPTKSGNRYFKTGSFFEDFDLSGDDYEKPSFFNTILRQRNMSGRLLSKNMTRKQRESFKLHAREDRYREFYIPPISNLQNELELTPEEFAKQAQIYIKRRPRIILTHGTGKRQILHVDNDGTSKDSKSLKEIMKSTMIIAGGNIDWAQLGYPEVPVALLKQHALGLINRGEVTAQKQSFGQSRGSVVVKVDAENSTEDAVGVRVRPSSNGVSNGAQKKQFVRTSNNASSYNHHYIQYDQQTLQQTTSRDSIQREVQDQLGTPIRDFLSSKAHPNQTANNSNVAGSKEAKNLTYLLKEQRQIKQNNPIVRRKSGKQLSQQGYPNHGQLSQNQTPILSSNQQKQQSQGQTPQPSHVIQLKAPVHYRLCKQHAEFQDAPLITNDPHQALKQKNHSALYLSQNHGCNGVLGNQNMIQLSNPEFSSQENSTSQAPHVQIKRVTNSEFSECEIQHTQQYLSSVMDMKDYALKNQQNSHNKQYANQPPAINSGKAQNKSSEMLSKNSAGLRGYRQRLVQGEIPRRKSQDASRLNYKEQTLQKFAKLLFFAPKNRQQQHGKLFQAVKRSIDTEKESMLQ